MATWMRTRTYNTTKTIEDKMCAIAEYDEVVYEDMTNDIKNNTYITSVYTDLLATELNLNNEQWQESIDNTKKIINNYYKKYVQNNQTVI